MCQAPLQVESHCEGRSSLGLSLGSTVSSLLSLVTGCPRGCGRSPPGQRLTPEALALAHPEWPFVSPWTVVYLVPTCHYS